MVMSILNDGKTPAASGPATVEGRRSTIVGGPEAASPKLLVLPRRRSFQARDKLPRPTSSGNSRMRDKSRAKFPDNRFLNPL